MKEKVVALVWLSTIVWNSASFAEVTISLPQDFRVDQNFNGISYEAYFDDRGSGGSGSGFSTQLSYSGVQSFLNGSVESFGPMYIYSGFSYPWVLYDQRDVLLLHPSVLSASEQYGASIKISAPTNGAFCVSGDFARANDSFEYGDGVDVLVFKNNDSDNPLFTGEISSSVQVDENNPFASESSLQSFNFLVNFSTSDSLRFVVFAGPADGSADQSYDATAIRLTITDDLSLCDEVSTGKPQISVQGGFIKLDSSSEPPSLSDCITEDHYGRMVFDEMSTNIYLCAPNGWITK